MMTAIPTPGILDAPCECALAGYCSRFDRTQNEREHSACKGERGDTERQFFRRMWDINQRRLAGEWIPPQTVATVPDAAKRTGPCVHLGPPLMVDGKHETRACGPCKGKTREKLFVCAVHDKIGLADCRRCSDYVAVPDEPGGLGPGHHMTDHWALAVPKGTTMALYDANGQAERRLEGLFGGQTVYFLGGGPSLLEMDLAALEDRPTIAVNSVCEVVKRPTVWIGVDPPNDPPGRFRGVPWDDPTVVKLLPRGWASSDTGADPSTGAPIAAYERPRTYFFLRNHRWAPWQFLTERSVNWGADQPYGAGRSVMLASLKLAFYLGGRRIVLLGCDWHMDPSRPYCHSAPKDARGSASNNAKFQLLGRRLAQLRPFLETAGVSIVNATPSSRLTAFDSVDLRQELERRCST